VNYTIQGSNTGSGKRIFPSPEHPHCFWAPPHLGTRDLPQGMKLLVNEANHPPLSNVEVKNGWSCTSTSYAFKVCRGETVPLTKFMYSRISLYLTLISLSLNSGIIYSLPKANQCNSLSNVNCISQAQHKLKLNKQYVLTSQKNSFPRRPQNQEIHDTSSELLIFLK